MNSSIKQQVSELRSALVSNDIVPIRQKLHQLVSDGFSNTCMFSKKFVYLDKFNNNNKRIIYVPCGHCAHCRSMRQADWVTRMNLQTLYGSKHVYFITLTYDSYDNYEDIPAVLLDAYWRKDNINYLHRETFSPCLLRHEHIVRFMKYLRKIHGSDSILFFQGSEYGSTYGRPHHHMILWSNEPISDEDIRQAWSCRLSRGKQTRLIGRVDFHDLNTTTSFTTEGVNIPNLGAAFHYVSKYCAKQICDYTLDSNARLNLFIRDLHLGHVTISQLNAVFNARVRSLALMYQEWAEYYAERVAKREQLDKFYNHLIYYYNEKEINETEFLSAALNPYANSPKEVVASDLRSFLGTCRSLVLRKVFRQYTNASRSEGLGTCYFRMHAKDYQRAKFVLPKSDETRGMSFVVPSLFKRLAKDSLLRYFAKDFRLGKESSFTYPCILENKYNLILPKSLPSLADTYIDPKISFLESCSNPVYLSFRLQRYGFVDRVTRTRCLVALNHDYTFSILHFRYNRSTHAYDYVYTESEYDFYESLRSCFESFYKYYDIVSDLQTKSFEETEYFFQELDTFIDTFIDDTDYIGTIYNEYVKKLNDLGDRRYKSNNTLKTKTL